MSEQTKTQSFLEKLKKKVAESEKYFMKKLELKIKIVQIAELLEQNKMD